MNKARNARSCSFAAGAAQVNRAPGRGRFAGSVMGVAAGCRQGFTLVEMLVVIAIITVLAGLVLAGVTAARRHSKEKATEATISRLGLAISRYEMDFGDFPDSGGMDGVVGCEKLLEALKSTAKSGPYIETNEFKLSDFNRNGCMELADEWGRPFRYQHHKYYKSDPNRRTYRLFSVGADGKEDTPDDIRNWDPDRKE
jgi:type II secretion system protein G